MQDNSSISQGKTAESLSMLVLYPFILFLVLLLLIQKIKMLNGGPRKAFKNRPALQLAFLPYLQTKN